MNETQQRLTMALSEVISSLNVLGSNNSETVATFFSRQHRTLQQQFVKVVVLPVLKQLDSAYESGAYDMRNQAAVDLAHKMLSAIDETDEWLPLI